MKSRLVTAAILLISQVAAATSFSGGSAKTDKNGPLSLLKVENSQVGKGTEQLGLVFGDKNGAELSQPGFYHVALDEGGTRLVIDLSQVQQTSVDQSDLKNILKPSNLVRSAEMTMDPVDKSLNITIQMKHSVTAKAQAGEGGKLLISLQDNK